ncbi:uncharacterized protein LOC143181106 [Calliopsis andreniformis]|uniref:uncharacterized protein LOC143181106 n=1 Tax=Calliopsis andreniformis TaxID=337506 RepID=UPI003FCC3517
MFGTWSKDKILQLLSDKLRQCICFKVHSLEIVANVMNDRRLWITIQSGLYSTSVLKTLQKNGMSMYNIIKAMKLGLINLNFCELVHFKDFKVNPYILEFKEMWSNTLSDDLISNLKTTGLSESECWHIIVYGIRFQNPRVLCHLMLSGIDVPRILSWQSPIKSASPEIIQFLRQIGIDEDVVQIVEQFGIDNETEQILIDLGLHEIKRKCSSVEETVCECSLSTLESLKSSLHMAKSICNTTVSRSTSTANLPDYFPLCNCQCHLKTEEKTMDELTAQRNDYLRQNVMVPLAWAMTRTLKYTPTDPVHYMMYQLLCWKHSNVTQTEKDSTKEFIAVATIAMDQSFIARKLLEEENLLKGQNQEIMKNIPCNVCKDHQQLRRIKEKCLKCIKRPLKKYESCKFPEMCSLCKIDILDRNNENLLSSHLEEYIGKK